MQLPIPILDRILVKQEVADFTGVSAGGVVLPSSFIPEDQPAGTVLAIGKRVQEIQVGDKVRWKKHPGLPATHGCEEVPVDSEDEDAGNYLVMVEAQVMVVTERTVREIAYA